MVSTLEVRWFRPGALPLYVRAWFDGLGEAQALEQRTDTYLVPSESDAVGVKRRQGRLEIKQRTDAPLATRWTDGVEGYVEAWRKWGFQLPNGAEPETGWVVVHKARQILRTPSPGSEDGSCCTLELGTVTLSGRTWWTLCLEAEGMSVPARREALRAAGTRWLAGGLPFPLTMADSAGYPGWLRRAARG